jgi:hypothetical protein
MVWLFERNINIYIVDISHDQKLFFDVEWHKHSTFFIRNLIKWLHLSNLLQHEGKVQISMQEGTNSWYFKQALGHVQRYANVQ